jgi:hypothetical protein
LRAAKKSRFLFVRGIAKGINQAVEIRPNNRIQLTQKASVILHQFGMPWPAFCAADPERDVLGHWVANLHQRKDFE